MADEMAPLEDSLGGGWPDTKDGPWYFRLQWGVIDGRVECVGLQLRSLAADFSAGTPEPLTTAVLRRFPLGQKVREELERERDLYESFAKVHHGEDRDRLLAIARGFAEDAAGARSRGGRPPRYGPEHFVDVATAYLGARVAPTLAVAERFHVSKHTAANWVARARRMGLLEPTTKGKTSRRAPRPDTKETER